MPSIRTTYVGIDVIADTGKGQREYIYQALNQDLKLQAFGTGSLEDIMSYVGGLTEGYVAVNAPRRPNQKLMRQKEVRQRFSPPPNPGSWLNHRVAEYELHLRNVPVLPTPDCPDACTAWQRAGFQLFTLFEQAEYQAYPAEGARRQSLEVHPHAAFCSLLGLTPFGIETLEGRLQRQLLLHELGIKIPDPMDFFEEVTRFKFLRGILPMKDIYTPVQLDALVAAYTAYLAANSPGQIIFLGLPEEGQIVLPGKAPENN